MGGKTQKNSVAAFPLWFLQKQNGWLKRWKQHEGCYRDFCCLLACLPKLRNLKYDKKNETFN